MKTNGTLKFDNSPDAVTYTQWDGYGEPSLDIGSTFQVGDVVIYTYHPFKGVIIEPDGTERPTLIGQEGTVKLIVTKVKRWERDAKFYHWSLDTIEFDSREHLKWFSSDYPAEIVKTGERIKQSKVKKREFWESDDKILCNREDLIFSNTGEPNNKRLKARAGDKILVTSAFLKQKLHRGERGTIQEVIRRSTWIRDKEYIDWHYKVRFESGRTLIIDPWAFWKVER